MKLLLFLLLLCTASTPNDTCTLPAPTSGSGVHNGSSISASWTAVSGAVGYRVIITDVDTAQIVFDDVISGTYKELTGTNSAHDYAVRVAPVCSGNEESAYIIVIDILNV